jgi:hypothetical protein
MRLHSSLLGLWLACGPVCGFAQVVDLRNDRVPSTELHGLVRFHTGDDPDGKLGWADPDFDERQRHAGGDDGVTPGRHLSHACQLHPEPWRDSARHESADAGPFGKELAIDSGLPKGLLPESIYGETACCLEHGARLTLPTDGVVEARSEAGELFGFERAATLSPEPAQEIAQAAEAFGQEDDITVLTLTFAPAEVLRA